MKRLIDKIPYFSAVVVVLVLWSCLSVFCYKYYYYPSIFDSATAILNGASLDRAEYELTDGLVYTQEVTCCEEAEGIALYLTDYDRSAEGIISISVYAGDGSLLVEREYRPDEVPMAGPLEIPFSETLPFAEQTLRITVEGTASEGRGFFLWTINPGKKDKELLYCGTERLPAKMAVGARRGFNTAAIWVYWIAALIVLLTAGVVYWLCGFKKVKIQTLFLAAAAGLGLCYAVVFPPGTVPDEPEHFSRAYRYSNVGFALPISDEAEEIIWTRECDLKLRGVPDTGFSSDAYRYTWGKLIERPQETELVRREVPASNSYPLLYLFPALGVFTGRLLGLSLPALYLLARLFNLAAFIAAVYGAIKWLPFGKPVLFGVALLPMTLNLVASCNYDCIIFALAFLVISHWLRMAFSEEPIRKRDIVLGAILNILLAPCKVVYVVLCGLCLLIPAARAGGRKLWFLQMGIYIIPAVLMLLFFQFTVIQGYAATETKILAWGDNLEGYTIGWVLQNFTESIKILIRTALQDGGNLMNHMMGSSLGRLELSIPVYGTLGFWALLLASVFCRKDEPVYLKGGHKLWLIALSAVFTVLTACTMLVGWTPFGSKTVIGLQGRYFIAVLPLLLFCLRNRILVYQKNCEAAVCLSFVGWQMFTVILILMQI